MNDTNRVEAPETRPILLRARDVATVLSCSERYVYRLIEEKKLSSVHLGRAVRIKRSEVERLAREGA